MLIEELPKSSVMPHLEFENLIKNAKDAYVTCSFMCISDNATYEKFDWQSKNKTGSHKEIGATHLHKKTINQGQMGHFSL